MNFTGTAIPGAYIVEPRPLEDDRGWFMRTYCKDEFGKIGHQKEWIQMNHSYTAQKGSIRGMHYQLPPHAEIKLVRCIAGAVYDVLVDVRKDSPSFLKWIGIELSAANRKMLYIPEGVAHGFQTLTEDCEMVYCHSERYQRESEGGLFYRDERINIQWPITITDVSPRDRSHPLLSPEFHGININI